MSIISMNQDQRGVKPMGVTKLKERKERALKMAEKLKRLFPSFATALEFQNNWQLLVAVMLSAQTTDKKVNEVTVGLFGKYPDIEDYLDLSQGDLEKEIRSIGLYRSKAKNILASARLIKEKFAGQVPDSMEELLTLPGVARKTANVVLWSGFDKVEGIAVDTHVRRFAQKFNLSDYTDASRIERDLMQLLPKKEWPGFTYRIIEYGRQFCPARKHDCRNHPLTLIFTTASYRWPKAN